MAPPTHPPGHRSDRQTAAHHHASFASHVPWVSLIVTVIATLGRARLGLAGISPAAAIVPLLLAVLFCRGILALNVQDVAIERWHKRAGSAPQLHPLRGGGLVRDLVFFERFCHRKQRWIERAKPPFADHDRVLTLTDRWVRVQQQYLSRSQSSAARLDPDLG